VRDPGDRARPGARARTRADHAACRTFDRRQPRGDRRLPSDR
jgi:hypothetical protein